MKKATANPETERAIAKLELVKVKFVHAGGVIKARLHPVDVGNLENDFWHRKLVGEYTSVDGEKTLVNLQHIIALVIEPPNEPED